MDLALAVIYTVGLVVVALLLYIIFRGPSPRRGRRHGTKGAAGWFVVYDSYDDHAGEGSDGSSSGGGWFGDGGGGWGDGRGGDSGGGG